jgi:hypothetical protein
MIASVKVEGAERDNRHKTPTAGTLRHQASRSSGSTCPGARSARREKRSAGLLTTGNASSSDFNTKDYDIQLDLGAGILGEYGAPIVLAAGIDGEIDASFDASFSGDVHNISGSVSGRLNFDIDHIDVSIFHGITGGSFVSSSITHVLSTPEKPFWTWNSIAVVNPDVLQTGQPQVVGGVIIIPGVGSDHIAVTEDPNTGGILVNQNGTEYGPFAGPITQIMISGLAGNGYVTVDNSITIPTEIDEAGSNDVIQAGGGPTQVNIQEDDNVLLGGNGQLTINGGGENDVFVPGSGSVVLNTPAGTSPPTQVSQSYNVQQGQTLTVQAPGLLGGLSQGTSDLAIGLNSVPLHGNLVLNNDGSFTYTPAVDFSGVDNFGYQVTDAGQVIASGAVAINVAAVPTAPALTVANVSGSAEVPIPLAITAAPLDNNGPEALTVVVSGVPAGDVLSAGTNAGGGTWVLGPADLPGLTLTAPTTSSFTLTATATVRDLADGATASSTGTFQVTIASGVPTQVSLDGLPPDGTTTVGSSITLTATVSTDSSATGSPTGTVTFFDGQTVLGSAPLQVVNGVDQASISTSGLPVGSHFITAAYGGSPSYAPSVSGGNPLVVEKVTPTLSWINPADIRYGTGLGSTQLDATASVAGSFTYSQAAGTVLHTGSDQTLSVLFTPDDMADYNPVSATVTINVDPAPLTITADNQSMAYGGALPTLTASYSGLANGDTGATLTGLQLTTVPANSHAGSYTITPAGASDPDYAITFVNGTLTIAPAPLTITAASKHKDYSAALPVLTASYSGFVNGDTAASLTTQPTLTTTATAASHVSGNPYSITASGAVDSDYTISYVSGTLTVDPVALSITADNQSMVYGGSLPSLTASYQGLVNGDGPSAIQGLTLSTVPASSHVGSYPITASGASDPDYTITLQNGTLSITPAPLTITGDNQTMVYGGTLPALTASYSGLVNGDTPSAIRGLSLLTVPATSHAGSYAITASGATDPDYNLTLANATLTISPAPLTISADNKGMVYGDTLPSLTASYAGLVNGDTPAVLTGLRLNTVAATSHAGSYAITASGASDRDYAISYTQGTLSITPATLTVTADNQSKVYGQANPALTASYAGFVNGDTAVVLSGASALATTAGQYSAS